MPVEDNLSQASLLLVLVQNNVLLSALFQGLRQFSLVGWLASVGPNPTMITSSTTPIYTINVS